MFPKASLTGRVERTNNTMRMAKSWGIMAAAGVGATCATILRIAPTTGGVALYLWGLFFQPPTIALAKGTAAFALLPAATGACYGNQLDKVELGRRPMATMGGRLADSGDGIGWAGGDQRQPGATAHLRR